MKNNCFAVAFSKFLINFKLIYNYEWRRIKTVYKAFGLDNERCS
nr:MAG TPA: hypothetical protein [Caudoviricetes sp.]